MRPRIAIPVPHSGDPEYAARAIPQYEHAVEMAGGEPVRIPLDKSSAEVMRLVESCEGIVLPGSKADVEPSKYKAAKHPGTAPADLKRDAVDELLLDDAYKGGKPVLGICYGLQILNVYREGTLVQHIESPINHAIGRKMRLAHDVEIERNSKLAEIVGGECNGTMTIAVNSSHHQSADRPGRGLRIVARSPQDGIIEALESTSPDHFVLAVQWHPERTVEEDEPSRAIFRALVEAAARWRKPVGELEAR
ncbi:MAG TPA: gamma-glutamyl-gamma-aminobutyrate hydrolase family protein [Terriglobales bacterium]|nr:gamma-glutamyl-gamma-aminobutyrate hydrolase family protein [Terriglobales bacterium]